MIDVLLPIFLLSLLIYLLRHLASGFTPSRSRYALPTHRLSQPERSGGGGGGGGWILETSHRTISLYTAAFNHVPKQIVKRWNKGMKRVYDVGALVGLLGSVVSIGGAMWALGEVWRTVWMEASIHAAEKGAGESVDVGSHLVKRAVEYMAVGAGSLPSSGWSSSGGFQPLVRSDLEITIITIISMTADIDRFPVSLYQCHIYLHSLSLSSSINSSTSSDTHCLPPCQSSVQLTLDSLTR